MSLKLLILKTGENIISEVREGYYAEKLICYILENPYLISVKGTYVINGDTQTSISLNKWPMLSSDNIIELAPDSVLTIVEPISHVKKLYTEVLENEQCSSGHTAESSSTDKSD